jgi:hypothetical protein
MKYYKGDKIMQENVQENMNENVENAYEPVNPFEQFEVPPAKPESVFITGLIGAIIGSLIGVAAWVLIYKLGFIAGIAGAITAICAMKGYKILGKVLDKKGVILSIIITIVMIYIANRISWAWEIYTVYAEDPVYKISFLEAFIGVDEVVSYSNLTGVYLKDLIIGYLLTVVAGYKDVIRAFREFD